MGDETHHSSFVHSFLFYCKYDLDCRSKPNVVKDERITCYSGAKVLKTEIHRFDEALLFDYKFSHGCNGPKFSLWQQNDY